MSCAKSRMRGWIVDRRRPTLAGVVLPLYEPTDAATTQCCKGVRRDRQEKSVKWGWVDRRDSRVKRVTSGPVNTQNTRSTPRGVFGSFGAEMLTP